MKDAAVADTASGAIAIASASGSTALVLDTKKAADDASFTVHGAGVSGGADAGAWGGTVSPRVVDRTFPASGRSDGGEAGAIDGAGGFIFLAGGDDADADADCAGGGDRA